MTLSLLHSFKVRPTHKGVYKRGQIVYAEATLSNEPDLLPVLRESTLGCDFRTIKHGKELRFAI